MLGLPVLCGLITPLSAVVPDYILATLQPDPPVVVAARATRPPAIDGRLDDPAWALADPATGFRQVSPRDGTDPSGQTEVRVAYDGTAIYIAARMYDAKPAAVVGRLGRRDAATSSDRFVVSIDSYHDRQTAFQFEVNAAGVRGDAVLANDRESADASWDPVWEASTRRDSLGWTAELRIPLSQLRFSERAAPVWGINFTREIFRRGEISRWSWTPSTAQGFVSNFGELHGLRDLPAPRRTEVTPYAVARSEHQEEVASGNPFTDGGVQRASAGLDLKQGLTSNITLDATINPDFGQVEADPAVVNLTAFETFYAELRPFFIEGAGILQFGQGGGGLIFGAPQLFYSRRIGRAPSRTVVEPGGYVDAPDATTILGAAKVSGQSGGWQLGFLDALTAREHARVEDSTGARRSEEIEPLSNWTVASLRRNLRGGASGVGFVGTGVVRDLRNPDLASMRSSAFTAGWDFFHRFGKAQYLVNGTVAASAIFGEPAAVTLAQRASARYYQRPDQDYVAVDTAQTSLAGYAGSLSVGKVAGPWTWATDLYAYSPGFEVNDMGYQAESDQVYGRLRVERRWLEGTRTFRRLYITANAVERRNFGWTRTARSAYLGVTGYFQNFWRAQVRGTYDLRSQSDKLTRGGPLMVSPAGGNLGFWMGTDARRRTDYGAAGTYSWNEFGGWAWGASVRATLRPSAAVFAEVQPVYQVGHALTGWVRQRADPVAPTFGRRYVFADLDQRTLSVVARVDVALSPSLSVQLYAQPFIASADYEGFKELAAAGTFDFVRYGKDRGSTIALDDGTNAYAVSPDPAGNGAAFSFSNPDFLVRSLRTNLVIRWEYHPGSTLFVVWQHGRAGRSPDPTFSLWDQTGDLFSDPQANTFLVKLNYWLSP
jgi:hypothetical protein